MKLLKRNDRYEVISTYAEKDTIKGAGGFRWDPERKVWWTQLEEKAARLWQAADGALRDQLYAVVQRVDASLKASAATDADIDLPSPAGLTYLPYQKAGVAYMRARKGTLLGDEMGLGKTIQVEGLINVDTTIKSVLVICPASLKINWLRETKKWNVRGMSVAIANGSLPATDVVVVNYDVLKKYVDALVARQWDLVVVDEAHYIKNRKAQRTVLTKLILAKACIRILLTGTPIVNRPAELYQLLTATDPERWPEDKFFSFAKKFCNAFHNGYGWDFSGAKNLDELQRTLRQTIMIRRLKVDVLKDLPRKTRQIVLLDGDKYGDLLAREPKFGDYKGLLDNYSKLDDSDVTVSFDEISRARHELALAKVEDVTAHVVETLESVDKVVVFAHHRDVIDHLMTGLAAYNPVKLQGGMSDREKQNAIDSFQNDANCHVFVGQIQAAGVGITLTAASTVIFAELDWVPGNVTQAEDRCHRIGQLDNVLVQHVVVDGSMDAHLVNVIIDKQVIIDQALDNPTKPFEMTVQVVAPVEKPKAAFNYKLEGVEEISAEQVVALQQMMQILAGNDPDFARFRNDVGFNGADGEFGHSLAGKANWSPRMAAAAKKMLRKYRRQIPAELYNSVYATKEQVGK